MPGSWKLKLRIVSAAWAILLLAGFAPSADAVSVKAIQERGVLRHLGVLYSNFITGSDDGFEIELMQGFAEFLGVRYQFVKTTWQTALEDVSGKRIRVDGNEVEMIGSSPVKGDVLASGVTVFDWRKKIVEFGEPTLPTQVWVLTRAESTLHPIQPGATVQEDIDLTKSQLQGRTVLGVANTCLDPSLYGLDDGAATVRYFEGSLNELAPAVIYEEADATLLDVPDALVALKKWPGKIKVLGPISHPQVMAPAFARDSDGPRKAFGRYLREIKDNGTYRSLINKYFPSMFQYFPEFFAP
jgi:ABC-type amino acid transport substrate-binding protein